MSDYYVSENDPATVKSVAERFGFCHVKRVFSAEETAGLERDLAMAHTEFNGRVPDLYSIPSLQGLLTDPRIVGFAKALLGDRLVYYRETNAAYEKTVGPLTEKPFTEFHCDARGTRADLVAPKLEQPDRVYPAYRFAIYFRNYRDYSGGLKVAPASHLRAYANDRKLSDPSALAGLPVARQVIGLASMQIPVSPVELYNVPSMPGDLVIFSLRTFHSAGARRMKARPAFATLPLIEEGMHAAAPQLFEPTSPGPRNAIFFDFGAPSEEVDFYAKWRALVSPTDLSSGYEYRRPPPPGLIVRNDRIIVALAERLAAGGNNAPGAEMSPDAQKDAGDFAALCAAHVEFSRSHPLFDRTAAARVAQAEGPLAAALLTARSILAQRDIVAANSRLAAGK